MSTDNHRPPPVDAVEMRISDADRNGTLRRLHNAVALGLIDIGEFEERSAAVSQARMRSDLDALVGDLPGPGAIVTSAADRVELRGVLGSLKRHGEWVVPTRLALHRRMGSVDLDLTRAKFAGPIVVIELDIDDLPVRERRVLRGPVRPRLTAVGRAAHAAGVGPGLSLLCGDGYGGSPIAGAPAIGVPHRLPSVSVVMFSTSLAVHPGGANG